MFVTFPELSVFRVSGKHAQRYLNNRLSNDIRPVSTTHACIAAALNAQGKTEAVFIVVGQSESSLTPRLAQSASYLLLSECNDHEKLRVALARFIVSESVTIELLANARLEHHWNEPTLLMSSEFNAKMVSATRYEIRNDRLGLPGTDVLFLDPELGSQTTGDWNSFELLRFKQGRPLFPKEILFDSLFAEAQLDFALSFSKGCYVGQEVVAKIDSRGKSPRVIRRISASDEIKNDTSITVASTGVSIGHSINGVFDYTEKKFYGFGVVKNDERLVAEPLVANGKEVTVGALNKK